MPSQMLFTIGDQYFQSTLTQTNPNRLHLFSGSNGLSVGYYPVLDNTEPNPGFTWITMAEILEKAGISWKVYQELDNFDDNGFAWFVNFQKAKPGDPLYEKGIKIVPSIVDAFGYDLGNGTLPQVSWIIAPTDLSEHPDNRPAFGEDLTARLVAKFGLFPEMYAKTLFILNYDEQGGFFDHIPPPTPPINSANGKSTVTTKGEIYQDKPIGLGFRVPLILISPWTTGGYVCSEVFDHTSVIKFIEKRFGITCPNISPWRRTVCGDLTSAFNFDAPNYQWPTLPDTSDYVEKAKKECASLPPPHVPSVQSLPTQEIGTKPSKALPYTFHIQSHLNIQSKTLKLTFSNEGDAGASFHVYDLYNPSNIPKHYTVSSKMKLSDQWSITGYYSLFILGPNGYVRQFADNVTSFTSDYSPQVSTAYKIKQNPVSISLIFNNTLNVPCKFTVKDNTYRTDGPWIVPVAPNSVITKDWAVEKSGNWYDFSVTMDINKYFMRRYMGRIETGLDSISDPAKPGNELDHILNVDK